MSAHTSHTPGPWRIGFEDGSGSGSEREGSWIVGPDNKAVVLGGDYDGCPVGVLSEPNARLIAAAPALLEALEDAANRLDLAAEELANELSGQFSIWADDARAAIKLAMRGESDGSVSR